MQDIKIKTRESLYWNYISSLSNNGVNFLTSIVLTSLLAPTVFGQLTFILLFLGVLNTVIGQGYSKAIIQSSTLDNILLDSVFWLNIFFGVVSFGVSVLVGLALNIYFDSSQYLIYTSIIGINFLLLSANALKASLLQRDLNFKYLSQLSIAATIVASVFSITIALNGGEIWALIFRIIIASVVAFLFLWFPKSYTPKFRFSRDSLTDIRSFSRNVLASSIVRYFMTNLDYFLVSSSLGMAELGIYNRAKAFTINITNEVKTKTTSIAFARLSKESDLDIFEMIVFNFILILNIIILPSMLMLVISSDVLINKYLDASWADLKNILKIFALSAIVLCTSLPGTILLARGDSKLDLRTEIYSNIFRLAVLIIAYFYASLLVFSIGVFITWCFTILIKNVFSYRSMSLQFRNVLRYHIYPIVFSLLLYLILNQIDLFDQIFLNIASKIFLTVISYTVYFLISYPQIKATFTSILNSASSESNSN